jgi:hypothetical protein
MKEDLTINMSFPFSINMEYSLSYNEFLQKRSLNAQLIPLKFSFYRVYIERIHNYKDPKEMDMKTFSSVFSFLFQIIKEKIKFDLQFELMRWLLNCCP